MHMLHGITYTVRYVVILLLLHSHSIEMDENQLNKNKTSKIFPY